MEIILYDKRNVQAIIMSNSESETSPCLMDTRKKHGLPYFETELEKKVTFHKSRRGELAVKICTSPKPLITWFHNDSIVSESDRITIEQTDDGWCKLCIRNVRENDSGVFRIVALNEVGMNFSETKVDIKLGPPIISSLCKSNILLEKGKKLCIVVSVKEYGNKYDVIWLHNLEQITEDSGRVRFTKKRHMCSLKLDSVEKESSGEYTCIVSSDGGETAINFNLDIQDEKNKENQMVSRNNNLSPGNRIVETFIRTKDQPMPIARKEKDSTIDIYSSVTSPAYKKTLSSPAKLSPVCRVKNFIKDTLNIRQKLVKQTINKSKSVPDISVFRLDDMAPKNNVKSYLQLVSSRKNDGDVDTKLTSLKTRSSSSPSLLNESVIVQTPILSRKDSPCSKASQSPFSDLKTQLWEKLKPSVNRQFSPYKSPSKSKANTPPTLLKYSTKQ